MKMMLMTLLCGAERPRSPRRARALVATLSLFVAEVANACPVCFGDPASPMTKGATSAVWFMLAIVGVVQIGFIALFVTLWRRARANKKFREQFHLIEGGAR